MRVCPISPLPFGPSLHMRLSRVAHTPLGELGWTFNVMPRASDYTPYVVGNIGTEGFSGWRQAQLLPDEFIAELAEQWANGQLQIGRNLAQEIYIDTLLAGSQIGEVMPLANREIVMQDRVAGVMLDLSA